MFADPHPASRASTPSLDAEPRPALGLLDGCPEALFLAHGFCPDLIDALIKAGQVAAASSQVRASVVAVRRLRITDAGRRALQGT